MRALLHFYDDVLRHCRPALKPLEQVHASLSTTGLLRNRHLLARLILHYSRLGHPECSLLLFNANINPRLAFLFNTILRALATSGEHAQALRLYSIMRRTGVRPDNYTFPFTLKACTTRTLLLAGKCVHCDVIKIGYLWDPFVEAALVDMYSKCDELKDGRKVFDGMGERDIVSWTAMITAFEQLERPKEALQLFVRMQEEEGLVADMVAAISVASAVGQLGNLLCARAVHGFMIRHEFMENTDAGNVIITMYAGCGYVRLARSQFDVMKQRDVISWNSMLSGYAQNGHSLETLLLFVEMLSKALGPDFVTILIVASGCAHFGSLHLARKFHSFIISSGMEIKTVIMNAVADMYAKCGDLASAVQIFAKDLEDQKDVNSWNVMISAYGMHGHGKEALKLFSLMRMKGVMPDHVTVTSVLFACSHAGLVEEGRKIFDIIRSDLLMMPTAKHYTCMVDLLGRAGRLEEARDLIMNMPMEPTSALWGALLGGCRIHNNKDLGELAAKRLFTTEPEHSGYYVLMSNIYAVSTRWDEVVKLRETMTKIGLQKPVAYSMIEFGRDAHIFRTAEQSHPEHDVIHRKLLDIVIEMKMAGYIPDGSCVLHDVEEEDKEIILSLHSEKLALVYGLMKLDGTLPIRIMKTIRICNDCHSAFIFISKLYKRKIFVRDAIRFHHFDDGSCSCNDYW